MKPDDLHKMKVSVVLGSFNRRQMLRLTVNSIRKELEGLPYELIIVDGGSSDGTLEWLIAQKDIISIVQHNRGTWNGKQITRRSWGYFMNLGFKAANGEYICMLSDDCLIVPGAIRRGLNLFDEKRRSGGKIGAMAFYFRDWPDEKKYKIGLTLGNKMFVNHGIYLKEALVDVGYINENYRFYFADGDLVLKMWSRGWECIESPESFIEHFAHTNYEVRKGNLFTPEEIEFYLNNWKDIFYDGSEASKGGWIFKEYNDPNATSKVLEGMYKRATLRRNFKRIIQGVKRRIFGK